MLYWKFFLFKFEFHGIFIVCNLSERNCQMDNNININNIFMHLPSPFEYKLNSFTDKTSKLSENVYIAINKDDLEKSLMDKLANYTHINLNDALFSKRLPSEENFINIPHGNITKNTNNNCNNRNKYINTNEENIKIDFYNELGNR